MQCSFKKIVFFISIFDSECVASAWKIRNWYNVASDTDDQLLQRSKKECIQYEIHGTAVVLLIDSADWNMIDLMAKNDSNLMPP